MNRKAILVALLLVGAMLLAASAYAQVRGGRGGGGRPGRQGGVSLAEAAATLELTESQQRQVNQILTAQQDMDNQAAAEREQLRQEIEQANQSGDTERARELRTQFMRRGRGGGAGRQTALEGLGQVLSEEQYAQLEEALAGPGRAERVGRFLRELRPLGLNIKQEAMVEKIMEEAMAKVQRSLTVDQREKLTTALEQPERGFGGGGGDAMRQRFQQMSEEQRAQLSEARDEYWEKVNQAETPEERRQLRDEMQRKMQEIFSSSRETPTEESPREPADE